MRPLFLHWVVMRTCGAALTHGDSKPKSGYLALERTMIFALDWVRSSATPLSNDALPPGSATATKASSTNPHWLSSVTCTVMGWGPALAWRHHCAPYHAATPKAATAAMILSRVQVVSWFEDFMRVAYRTGNDTAEQQPSVRWRWSK